MAISLVEDEMDLMSYRCRTIIDDSVRTFIATYKLDLSHFASPNYFKARSLFGSIAKFVTQYQQLLKPPH